MPKEGITVESCLIGEWRKETGETVAVDDVLFEYETDKAAFECLSTASGVLLHKFYQAGDEVPVLTPVAIIGEEGEDISALLEEAEMAEDETPVEAEIQAEDEAKAEDEVKDEAETEEEVEEEAAADDENEAETPEAEANAEDEVMDEAEAEGLKVSPRAQSFADEQGIDPSLATPTGPGGRILEADVIAAYNAASAEAEKEYEAEAEEEAKADDENEDEMPEAEIRAEDEAKAEDEVKDEAETETAQAEAEDAVEAATRAEDEAKAEDEVKSEAEAVLFVDEQYSKIRTVIGKTMLASLQRGAQLTNHHSFDATNVLMMRDDFKTSDEALGYQAVSIGDIILYVTSRVLVRHPEINALVAETGIRKYFTVNLAFACDTPRGLLVPVIFGAERKSLREISSEVKELAASANEGRISPDKLSGGTFTVSNLGTTGVEVFTPIINPPQAAIAGISGIVERVRKGRGGRVEIYPSIGVSLTYDHRAIDGAPASRFAAELCEALADFSWKTIAVELENE